MPRRPRNTHINNYILEHHLSRGGFGSIYKAIEIGADNTVLRNDVAVKVMHTSTTSMGKSLLENVTAKELYGMDFYHTNLITYYGKGDDSTADTSDDFHEKMNGGAKILLFKSGNKNGFYTTPNIDLLKNTSLHQIFLKYINPFSPPSNEFFFGWIWGRSWGRGWSR